MMDMKEIWQIDDQVRYRRLFDEGVLIHQEQANALILNDTGIAFLELCDGQRNTGEIIESLGDTYDVDAETLAEDLESFISELAGQGIIRSSPQE
ncbi:PqqD family protein [Pseudomonadota bacterium]